MKSLQFYDSELFYIKNAVRKLKDDLMLDF